MSSPHQRRAKPDARQAGIGGPGTGLSVHFICSACAKRIASLAGRRLLRVGGVKRWVCKECLK